MCLGDLLRFRTGPKRAGRADESGAVRGTATAAVLSFKNIPYAAAPEGEWRWRPPRPVENWDGEWDSTTWGPRCAQVDTSGKISGVEDCLRLNVWTPAAAATEARPVMVWIHGGSLARGSAMSSSTDGASLVERTGVVLVGINYRLGQFGFLPHRLLAAESGTMGNYGLLDQVAALEWVRRNIAAFGGDPRRVAILWTVGGGILGVLAAGESSGARVVLGGHYDERRVLGADVGRGTGRGPAVRGGGRMRERWRSPCVPAGTQRGERPAGAAAGHGLLPDHRRLRDAGRSVPANPPRRASSGSGDRGEHVARRGRRRLGHCDERRSAKRHPEDLPLSDRDTAGASGVPGVGVRIAREMRTWRLRAISSTAAGSPRGSRALGQPAGGRVPVRLQPRRRQRATGGADARRAACGRHSVRFDKVESAGYEVSEAERRLVGSLAGTSRRWR